MLAAVRAVGERAARRGPGGAGECCRGRFRRGRDFFVHRVGGARALALWGMEQADRIDPVVFGALLEMQLGNDH